MAVNIICISLWLFSVLNPLTGLRLFKGSLHPASGCCNVASSLETKRRRNWSPEESLVPPPSRISPSLWASPGQKEKIKTNRTLISGPRFSLLSCRQKEPSPGRLPQIKASCSPLAASPIRITTTKPAETIIYSFWCGFWSYPTSSTMPPPPPALLPPPPPLPRPAPPAFCIFYSQGNKVMPAPP